MSTTTGGLMCRSCTPNLLQKKRSKGFLPLMELILTLLRVCVVQVLSCMHFVHLSSLISLLFPSHAHTLSFSLSLSPSIKFFFFLHIASLINQSSK
ncbi:hypothetical protein L2E82_20418 [Cichorium intybus]|uniref:Uncharacterized protein n=1 Tax=Cichorium intybus TaxID=13427 RepID=A0ACB9DU39_CICIN|nr:hypothetical protein L2E82_20418 [Cichorium intybus]